MNRFLRIAARVAAQEEDPDTDAPIDSDAVDELITMLKRQMDMISQSAQRDNPQRAVKLLEQTYSALNTLLTMITRSHPEVEDRKNLVEDKMEQVTHALRPIRMQIH